MSKLINSGLFLLTAAFLLLVFFVVSLNSIHVNDNIVRYSNTFFALLFLVKCIRTKEAFPLLFGFKSYQNKRIKVYKALYYLVMIASVFLVLNVLNFYSILTILIVQILFVKKSKYYSIEDIYFQNTVFHLFLMNCSVFAGNQYWLEYSALSFFISNGIIMLSAGYEKFKSPLWQKGRGAITFLSLPHLVRKEFHFVNRYFKSPNFIVGYLIMIAEFTFLFSIVNNNWFLFNLFLLSAFSITLFVVVDISFIGQILLLNFILLGFMYFEADIIIRSSPAFKFSVFPAILFFVNLLSLINVFFYSFSLKNKLTSVQKFLTGINSPIGVFSEKHQIGFYTFRMVMDDQEVVLKTFCEQGYPSKYQFWFPRYFQGAMYPVTDFCISWNKYGEPLSLKQEQVIDLLFSGFKSSKKLEGEVSLSVKKYDDLDTIETYVEQPWTTICSIYFSANEVTSPLRLLKTPPLLNKHFRIC